MVEALAVQRELGGRFDLRVAATLAEAHERARPRAAGGPTSILANPSLPDSEGARHAPRAAGRAPRHTDRGQHRCGHRGRAPPARGAGRRGAPAIGSATRRRTRSGFLHQSNSQSLLAYRIETIAEIDRVTRQAADAAVTRAIDELLDRLGLGDEEGLRMAIRLARGWEAAKIRFVSAVTTGLASALPARDRRRHRGDDAARRLEVSCRRG